MFNVQQQNIIHDHTDPNYAKVGHPEVQNNI